MASKQVQSDQYVNHLEKHLSRSNGQKLVVLVDPSGSSERFAWLVFYLLNASGVVKMMCS